MLTIPRTQRLPGNANRARIHVTGMAITNVTTTLRTACQVVNHNTFHVAREDNVSEIVDIDMSDVNA